MPGALTPEQVAKLIPKDIVIANWFWHDHRAKEGRGEPNDIKLSEWGFRQVHANFTPAIQNYARRTARKGVLGGAPSSWAATNEYTFGKDLMHDFSGHGEPDVVHALDGRGAALENGAEPGAGNPPAAERQGAAERGRRAGDAASI